VIDAHVHFWNPARNDDILIVRREPSLRQRFMPPELLPQMAAAGVTRAIAIQSAPNSSETDHLIATCEPVAEIAGVVGWVDLAAADAARSIAALARRPKVVGVRAMLNRVEPVDWLASAQVRPGLAALADAGLTLDLIARTEHIPAILIVAAALSHLRLVVDHGATAPLKQETHEAWRDGVGRLGRETSAFTKFSGLAEEAHPDWTIETLRPAVRHLFESFGASRIMWASNWPVIDLRGGYAKWSAASRRLLDELELGVNEGRMVRAGSAQHFYRVS
jgi:L-fuconolactonase